MTRISIILLLFFLPFFSVSQKINSIGGGTTIIISVFNDTIWLAADSKQYNVYFDKKDTVYSEVKKIYGLEKIRYGFVGNVIVNEKDWADSIVKQCLKYGSSFTLEQKIDASIEEMRLFIESFCRDNYNLMKEMEWNNNILPFVSVFFCYLENNIPKVIYVDFRIKANKIHWKVDHQKRYAFNPDLIVMGHGNEVMKVVRSDKYYISKAKNKSLALIKLIELEIKHSPTTVGKPIDMCIITKDTIREYRVK